MTQRYPSGEQYAPGPDPSGERRKPKRRQVVAMATATAVPLPSAQAALPLDQGQVSTDVKEALTLERAQVWDRYKTLEDTSTSRLQSLSRHYVLVGVFASAPFAAAPFADTLLTPTPFVRVWAFGGIWFAVLLWLQTDRFLGGYGEALFERVLCMHQIRRVRRMLGELSPTFRRHSLLPVEEKDVRLNGSVGRAGDPLYVDQDRLNYTVNYFKWLSLLPPLYVVLFIGMLLYPTELTDAAPGGTATVLRVAWYASVVWIVWVVTINRRCRSIMECGFRARRISDARKWPLFPTEQALVPTSWRERLLSWGYGLACIGAAVLAGINVAYGMSYHVDYVEYPFFLPGDLWTPAGPDATLALLTLAMLILAFAFAHFEVTARLDKAKVLDSGRQAILGDRRPGKATPTWMLVLRVTWVGERARSLWSERAALISYTGRLLKWLAYLPVLHASMLLRRAFRKHSWWVEWMAGLSIREAVTVIWRSTLGDRRGNPKREARYQKSPIDRPPDAPWRGSRRTERRSN